MVEQRLVAEEFEVVSSDVKVALAHVDDGVVKGLMREKGILDLHHLTHIVLVVHLGVKENNRLM